MECNFARRFAKKKYLTIVFALMESDYTLSPSSNDCLASWLRLFIGDSLWLPMWDESHVRKVARKVSEALDNAKNIKLRHDPYNELSISSSKSNPAPLSHFSEISDAHVDFLLSKTGISHSPIRQKIDLMNNTYSPGELKINSNIKKAEHSDNVQQAWNILHNSSNVEDQDALNDIVDSIGLNDFNDLRHCERTDVLLLTRTLKKVQQKKFLDTLFGKMELKNTKHNNK